MKKHQLRTVMIAGLLIAALAVGAAAAVGVQTITATLRPDITVKVDGDAQTMYDKNGEIVHPISYDGSTYLPIRAIGELLEQEVVWDTKTQTVSLSTRTETAPEDLTYDVLTGRAVKLENRYTTLHSDLTDTARAGTYAENLTIYHRLNDRRTDLRDDLKSLQVDVSEAYRTGTVTKSERGALLDRLETLDGRLTSLHASLLEKYGITEEAAAYRALRAEALALQDDQADLEALTSDAVKAKSRAAWEEADAAARRSWKTFRNDVTALQVALNDSLRQSVVSYAEYNEVSELAGALDVACKDLKADLDAAEETWTGKSDPDVNWSDRDAEYYADQIGDLKEEADRLLARCRDYFTGRDRDRETGVSLMAEAQRLDDRIDDLEDAVEDSGKLGRETRWELLRSLDKAEDAAEKAEDFLEKAGVDDDWGDDHDRGRRDRDDDDDRDDEDDD